MQCRQITLLSVILKLVSARSFLGQPIHGVRGWHCDPFLRSLYRKRLRTSFSARRPFYVRYGPSMSCRNLLTSAFFPVTVRAVTYDRITGNTRFIGSLRCLWKWKEKKIRRVT